MDQKHAWDKLVNLSGNPQQDYQAVQPFIRQAIECGVRAVENGVVVYRTMIQGQEIVVRGRELANGAFEISNAFIQTLAR